MTGSGIPRVEFEGIKFNLNSILLMVGLAIGASAWITRGDNRAEAFAEVNARQDNAILDIRTSMTLAITELRREMASLRAQDASIAVLKNDVESIKNGMNRIERKLEGNGKQYP